MKKTILTLALSLFALNANAMSYVPLLTCTNNEGSMRVYVDSKLMEIEVLNLELKAIYALNYKGAEMAFEGTVDFADDYPVKGLVDEPSNGRPLTITLSTEGEKITTNLKSNAIDSTFACEIK